MSPAPAQLAALRHLIAARYPSASRTAGNRLATELPAIDDPTHGGLPTAALTELVCPGPSCGSHLLLGQLLAATRQRGQRVALVDPAHTFDPASHPASDLEHLIWARDCDTPTALTVTDLLARDANLHLVILDLTHAPAHELRRIPATLWYRLQRAVESTALSLLVFSPRALVPSTQLRLQLTKTHHLTALDQDRPDLLPLLTPSLTRQRSSHALSA